ncbi:MAG: TM2 domain-containing protein [Clostridia bacterium]|nr:TM2 domain-containing protein [Clostridia bacterium]
MTQDKVDAYIMANAKYFPSESIYLLKEKLSKIPDDKMYLLQSIELKEPTTILLCSLFLGSFGVDRFMLGETGMGVLKLLTGGLCGILTIIDWFTCMRKAKETNLNKVMTML